MKGLYDQIVEAARDPLQPPFRCRSCGGTEFRAWYPVDQCQGIVDIVLGDHGELEFEYDGCTRDGDAGDNDEYRCATCDDAAKTLEQLVGITPPDPTPRERIEQLQADCGYDEIEDTGIDSLIDYKNALEDLAFELLAKVSA